MASGGAWAGGRRQLVAVWFCDVVGSTEIVGELGDVRFRRVIAQFLASIRWTLRRHGGREIDTAGDGMFVTFDTPTAALRAAVESTAAVRDLGIEIRSGVHLGEVEQDADGRVGGIAVHLGARIMSLAGAGEILTTRTTSELASGAGLIFENRGTRELRGIAGEHAIVAVVGADEMPMPPPLDAGEAARRRAMAGQAGPTGEVRSSLGPSQPSSQPFVGRTRELDELTQCLGEAAATGRGALYLVSGEPGIGKTRLLTAVSDGAEARGWPVLVGRCWEGGGAPAYWPWIQVLRGAGREFAQLATIAEGAGASAGVAPRDAVSDQTDHDTARFQMFDEVSRTVADVARDRPCLIVLEDLHAADESSLLLLRFVAGSIREHPIVLLGSYRESDARARERATLFGDLARLGHRTPLRGLTTEAVASYIALVSGEAASEPLARRIGDVTGGNPFFVGEIVRELMARGALASVDDMSALPVPEEVRSLIRRRFGDLSPPATELLQVAAVIGREFDVQVISAAMKFGADRVIDLLKEAVRAGVIIEGRDAAGIFTFAHDLHRETLYEDLPAARRMDLHRTLGTSLEELFHDQPDPYLAEIAHHLASAAPLGDAQRAVDYSIRAGDRSLAVFAYEDAAKLYSQAVDLLGAAAPSERGARIQLKLGDARSRSGDAEAARRDFERAAWTARSVGASEAFALAALGYGAAEKVRAAYGGLALTVPLQEATTGIALLEEALASLPEEDGPLRARALAMLATELYWQAGAPAASTRPNEERDRYLEFSRKALDMAHRLADPDVMVEALYARHWVTLGPDTLTERLENARQMLRAATTAHNDEFAFLARQARVHCFLELCDVSSIDAQIEAMDELARRTRQPVHAWHVKTLRVMRTFLEGRLAEAEEQAAAAVEASGVSENAYVRYMFEHAQMFGIRWAQGRLGEILDRIHDHGARYRGFARWRDALAAAELGDVVAATSEVVRFGRDKFSVMPRAGLWIIHACALTEACVLLRDERAAEILYELLVPFEDRNAITVSTIPFGPVATRLGMVATLLGRWTDAERHLERAKELCDAMGARAIRVRVLVEQARMLQARGGSDDARAREVLSEAGALCDELELPGIGERVAALSRVGPR